MVILHRVWMVPGAKHLLSYKIPTPWFSLLAWLLQENLWWSIHRTSNRLCSFLLWGYSYDGWSYLFCQLSWRSLVIRRHEISHWPKWHSKKHESSIRQLSRLCTLSRFESSTSRWSCSIDRSSRTCENNNHWMDGSYQIRATISDWKQVLIDLKWKIKNLNQIENWIKK